MTEHTCSYCDGTLHSTRPLCLNCGHPLCQELTTVITTYYTFGNIRSPKETKESMDITSCPKCGGVNELMNNQVISMRIAGTYATTN